MTQSAVEWLIKQIKSDHIDKALTGLEWMKIFEQARLMEKDQIVSAYQSDRHPCSDEDAEQYYNETYSK